MGANKYDLTPAKPTFRLKSIKKGGKVYITAPVNQHCII